MQLNNTDFTGKRFGRLVVKHKAFDKGRFPYWHCKCDCGSEKDINVYSLISGNTKSCGCIRKEKISSVMLKHGGKHERLYKVWCDMKTRCYNENNSAYKHYGGRGISVCDDWKNDYSAFKSWAISSGYDENAEKGKCTLDRIDVNGNYEPGNCRWVDTKTQANNTRANVKFNYDGGTYTLSELSDKYGIPYKALHLRVTRYGMSIDEAIHHKYGSKRNIKEQMEDAVPEILRKAEKLRHDVEEDKNAGKTNSGDPH